jgi:hypothetical protein
MQSVAVYFSLIEKHNERYGVFTAETMKNAVFWDMKTQFIPHKKHITSPLQTTAG